MFIPMTIRRPAPWSQTILFVILGAIVFPLFGLAGSALLLNGNLTIMTSLMQGYSWLLIFMAIAGIVCGFALSRIKASLVELIAAGLMCAFVAVYVLDVLFEGALRQVSILACAFTAIPVAFMVTAIVSIPRLIVRMVKDVG